MPINSKLDDADKLSHELDFWTKERRQYLKWYNGQLNDLYHAVPPTESQKVKRFDSPLDNALYTWLRADWDRYLRHLYMDEFVFEGKKILDVGGGPLGLVRAFVGVDAFVIDPLTSQYIKAGYPIGNQKITYLEWEVEDIHPHYGNTFDGVISVNAIDHVRDFEQAIRMIEYVTKPTGVIRLEVHYHAATKTEPVVLDDERVLAAFSDKFQMRKIHEVPFRYFYPGYNDPSETLALWSNSPELFAHNPLPSWK